MNIIKNIVLIVRFLLEVVTVLGLIYGGFIQKELLSKILFIALGIIIFVAWSIYGAPKSPQALESFYKLGLEMLVYGIGVASFYFMYTKQAASIYTVIVIVDLVLMYMLNLQGK